jgi:hypothetical protein
MDVAAGELSLWITFIFNPIGAIIIILALFSDRKMTVAPKWHRVGLMTIACGLIGQTYRSGVALLTGFQPTDAEMPFWVFKDIGIVFLAFYYSHLFYIKFKK